MFAIASNFSSTHIATKLTQPKFRRKASLQHASFWLNSRGHPLLAYGGAAAVHRRRLARGTSVRRRRARRPARSDPASMHVAPSCCPADEAALDSALSRPAPASRGRPGGRSAGACALAVRPRVACRTCPVLLPAARRQRGAARHRRRRRQPAVSRAAELVRRPSRRQHGTVATLPASRAGRVARGASRRPRAARLVGPLKPRRPRRRPRRPRRPPPGGRNSSCDGSAGIARARSLARDGRSL
jgi:hypothetical protein